MNYEEKVKQIDKTGRFLRFSADKSMPFIARKHAFLEINSMLLSNKSIEFIFRKHNKNCNALIVNALQNCSFSHDFRQNIFPWKILQGKC